MTRAYDIPKPPHDDWIIVPVEIRAGTTVRIQIPPNLTKGEAEKIARVVMAYGGPG